jgi:hypothetical protein
MYLDKQHGIYGAQLRIPNDPGLREYMGKTAFRKSLKTRSKREAQALATPLVKEWKLLVNQARTLINQHKEWWDE